jgi:hypothetical protein
VRLITAADDELYGLASAVGKLGRPGKLLALLAEARAADPRDAEAAARLGLAMMAVLPGIGLEFAAHARFTATVEALDDALALDPRNWLARYSRARLRALIPSSYGAYAVQGADDLASARDDLDRLIRAQAALAAQPYFISAHVLAAVIDRLAGTRAPADRPALLEALAACPRTPVRLPALGAVLCEPLATLYADCEEPERGALGEVLAAVYRDQPAARDVRRHPVRR